MPLAWILAALVVLAAFAVESSLGFGATVITLSVGAQLVPMRALLAAFIPVNLALSAWLALKNVRDVDRAALLRRVGPWMLLGIAPGLFAVRHLGEAVLRRGFGVFAGALALSELVGMARASMARTPAATASKERAPQGASSRAALLVLGGFMHGAFGGGGPMAVYVAGQMIPDKTRFRATLSALWLVLNAILVGGYALDGSLGVESARRSALFVPPLLVGTLLGEVAHRRVPERAFRVGVYALLLAAAVMLVAR